MAKNKDVIDKERYKIHWEHTANLHKELEDYFRFMVCDGNIKEETYGLMLGKLNELFDQYKDIYENFIIIED